MKRVHPDIFKNLQKLLQYGCNLGWGKYTDTVAYAYYLLGIHSSQLLFSTSGHINWGYVV